MKNFDDIRFQELQEGLYDPNIFKAFFLAGGPGSGKSFVTNRAFGGTGLKTINSDNAFERALKKNGLSLKMPEDEAEARDILRDRAKAMTGSQMDLSIRGRLGLVIDGTGRDYDKIKSQKAMLDQLGYDCYMIFVNTTLEVALERNENRDRVLPQSIVSDSHKEVNRNIGAFQGLFGSGNFMIVDNNTFKTEEQAKKRFKMLVKQGLSKFIKTPITNKKALSWISKQKILRGK